MFSNGSVQTTAAGMPRISSSIPSCTLHELQDPQSPTPTTTAWQRAAIMSRMSFGAMLEASGLRA
jgi:hypothetical protein